VHQVGKQHIVNGTVTLYPPEDEHLRLETCKGEYYFMNK